MRDRVAGRRSEQPVAEFGERVMLMTKGAGRRGRVPQAYGCVWLRCQTICTLGRRRHWVGLGPAGGQEVTGGGGRGTPQQPGAPPGRPTQEEREMMFTSGSWASVPKASTGTDRRLPHAQLLCEGEPCRIAWILCGVQGVQPHSHQACDEGADISTMDLCGVRGPRRARCKSDASPRLTPG